MTSNENESVPMRRHDNIDEFYNNLFGCLKVEVADGIVALTKLGDALTAIYKEKLYENSFETFGNFVKHEFDLDPELAAAIIRHAARANAR